MKGIVHLGELGVDSNVMYSRKHVLRERPISTYKILLFVHTI